MDLRICFCSNFLSSILNSNKKDEKAMTVIDVSGCGSGAVFLIKGKANLLFEAGMAYAADQMVENIKRELGDAELDAVLLSHSHYDHVAGLPAVRKAWPGVKTYASERAKEILVKPGALKTIRRLSGEAAEAAGLSWDSEYDDSDLQIDVSLEDGETIELGDHTIYAFATIGHTKCSMSYLIDDELMLCSETVGVMGHDGSYMPSFLVDYKAAEESIEYSSELDAKEIILNHYGFVSEADRATIWDVLMQKLRDSRDAMIDIMNRFPEEETALREMERVFHSHVDKKEQPDEAFYINAASMMKTLRRQFPERFPRHFQLIAAVDRNWGIGNKGQMLTVIPADQKLFRQETMGKIIVMGYKTFLTFPAQRPLDGRINLILTKKKALSVKGAEICHSVEEALVRIDELKQEKHLTDVDVVIIGGESVYRQFLPFCETAQITWIDFSYVADTHMVDLEKEGWELVRRSGEQTFFNLCYEFREYRKLEKESF